MVSAEGKPKEIENPIPRNGLQGKSNTVVTPFGCYVHARHKTSKDLFWLDTGLVRIFVGPMPSKPRDGETADPIRSLLVLVKRKFMFYPVLSLFSFLAQRKLDTDATV